MPVGAAWLIVLGLEIRGCWNAEAAARARVSSAAATLVTQWSRLLPIAAARLCCVLAVPSYLQHHQA